MMRSFPKTKKVPLLPKKVRKSAAVPTTSARRLDEEERPRGPRAQIETSATRRPGKVRTTTAGALLVVRTTRRNSNGNKRWSAWPGIMSTTRS